MEGGYMAGPGFSPSKTLVAVEVYPAIAGKDTKFSPVKFSGVKIDGKSLTTFTHSKLTAKQGKKILARATPIVGEDSFKVKYEA
jgi:hypothetical protein